MNNEQQCREAFERAWGAEMKRLNSSLSGHTAKEVAQKMWMLSAAQAQQPIGYAFKDIAGKEHAVIGALPGYAQSDIVALHASPAAQPVDASNSKSAIMQALSHIAYLAGDITDDSLRNEIAGKVGYIVREMFGPTQRPAAQPVDAAKDAPSEPLNCAVMPNGDCVMTLQEAYRSGSKMTQRFAEAIKNAPAFNMNGYDDDDVRRLHDWAVSVVHLTKQAAQPVDAQIQAFASCSKEEVAAFESFLESNRYDMTTHPLHWLFLDGKSYAARDGWQNCLQWVRAVLCAAPVDAQQERDSDLLRIALMDLRNFFEAERKTISKGNNSHWARWQCEEQIEIIDAALAQGERT